jgi:hypothetical protein
MVFMNLRESTGLHGDYRFRFRGIARKIIMRDREVPSLRSLCSFAVKTPPHLVRNKPLDPTPNLIPHRLPLGDQLPPACRPLIPQQKRHHIRRVIPDHLLPDLHVGDYRDLIPPPQSPHRNIQHPGHPFHRKELALELTWCAWVH